MGSASITFVAPLAMQGIRGIGLGACVLLPLALLLPAGAVPFYSKRFLGMGWGLLLWLGCVLGGIGAAALRAHGFGMLDGRHYPRGSLVEIIIQLVFSGLLVVFAAPFAIRLYRKWTGPHLTDNEKLTGVEGVRAWLGPGNVILALLISLCAWLGYDYSFWAVLALAFGLLLAYPLISTLAKGGEPAPAPPLPAPPDLSDERERVLKLLEEGKVTADEGAELLSALGDSAPTPPLPPAEVRVSMTPGRKMTLIGAGVVLVAFILPWYSINLGQKGVRSPLGPNIRMRGTPGGDVHDHLGWYVLALATGAAILPYVATKAKPRTLRVISFVALAAGGVILVHLLTRDLRHVSIGLVLAIAGYAAEGTGVAMDRPAAA